MWTSEMLKGCVKKGAHWWCSNVECIPHHCITAWGCLSLGFLKFVLFLLLLLFFSISILQCCKARTKMIWTPSQLAEQGAGSHGISLGGAHLEDPHSCTSTGWKAKSLFSDVMLKLMPLEHFAQVGRHSLAIPEILHYAVHLRQGCAQKMFPGGRDVAGYSDLQPPKSARVAVREGKGFTFPTQWFCGWAKTLYRTWHDGGW